MLTWLGSTAFIIPVGLAIGLYFVIRRRDWRPLALLAAAVAGAVALYGIVKFVVGRPRPPAAIWIGHYTGAAFPSGHATQSTAFYAMLAIVLGAGLSARRRAAVWAAAALVVLIVGASRIYLGAHWLTDVLAGYALGACWVAIVVAVLLIRSSGTGRVRPVRERGHTPTPGHQNRQKPHSPAPRPAKAPYAVTGRSQRHSSPKRPPPRASGPLDQEDRGVGAAAACPARRRNSGRGGLPTGRSWLWACLVFWSAGQDVAQQGQLAGGFDPVPGRGGQFLQRADRGSGAAHPPTASVHRERPPGGIEVRGQQAPAGFGHPVHLAERRLPLAGGDVVNRERAGDHVKRHIRQRQVLGGADGEGDGGGAWRRAYAIAASEGSTPVT